MPIETTAPPVEGRYRTNHRYDEFLNVVRERNGDWASLQVEDSRGKMPRIKQTMINQAARQRGFRVQTTIQQARLYARMIAVPEQPAI